MKIKKALILLCLFMFLLSFVTLGGVINADEGYGVVVTDQGEMYRDTYGNLFPIVIIDGKKEVKLNQYELAPLEALLERDEKESKGESALPEELLNKYYYSNNFSILTNFYVALPAIYSYKQKYWKWNGEDILLGFGPDTIAESGCFLTSCAMMLATYNLTLNGSTVSPLNLNDWLKENGGFNGDELCFDSIANFPGIKSVGYFDSCSDAQIAIYNHIVPIIAIHHPDLHFCVLVKTNGINNTATNWIIDTYGYNPNVDYYAPERMYYAPYDNIEELVENGYYGTLLEFHYTFADSQIFRTAYPQ